jgi:hypothetical protein
MKLVIDRKWKKQKYTISNLFINGEWFCNVLEDKDRGLKDSMSVYEIKCLKQWNTTAIPSGTYKVTLDIISPKFSTKSFYKEVCGGKLPRLLDVKCFDGILIHAGNNEKHSSGCLLVGHNKIKGQLVDSKDTFKALYKRLKEAKVKGEEITIKILE